jgi:hypothetical protein
MNYNPNDIDALACELAEVRAKIEEQLIGGILSVPAMGVVRAEQSGVDAAMFDQDDLRAMFVAIVHARDRPKPAVICLVKALMMHMGFWDSTDTVGSNRGMKWGDRSLNALADSYPGPVVVSHFARKLKAIDARQRQARACCHELHGLLAGKIQPHGPVQAAVGSHLSRRGETYVNSN